MAKHNRVDKFRTEKGLTLLEGWARKGLSMEQIAQNCGVVRKTLYVWQKKYPEIEEALDRGKEVVDLEIENAMYKSAMGYYVNEEKMIVEEKDGIVQRRQERYKRYIKPEVAAQIFWLKNRNPEEWREKVQVEDTTALERAKEILDNVESVI
ncbi:MAG: helix-turn-helix domain-containing protein [Tissierellia bacterium]|nr:helix-turn-helix domain-containing protein [Tissierellia bacterium]